jgi:hypothetical protein
MNKCLTVHVPQGAGKRAAPSTQERTESRLAFGRAAQIISRASLGVFLSGLSGTTESTPLVLAAFRLLSAVVQWLRASPSRSARDQLTLAKADGHAYEVAGVSDLGRGLVQAEPVRNHQQKTFRGAWTHTESGARFERRRLMRMHHAIRSEDSR